MEYKIVNKIESLPWLAITMGDPAGIGPEVVASAITNHEVLEISNPIVVGDDRVLVEALRLVEKSASVTTILKPGEIYPNEKKVLVIRDGEIDWSKLKRCIVSDIAGEASHGYVEKAANLALIGQVDAIVTGPINKEAWKLAGYDDPGHTELLAKLTKAQHSRMLLVGPNLRVIHVTTHVPLFDVKKLLTIERVFTTISLLMDALLALGINHPRVAVSGLNPHAGEGGIFGDEEINIIVPAINQAKANNWEIYGPLAGDTVFYRASQGEFDAVVAMYHDQGHIPLKMLGFDEGVNVTLGLPIVRTSVDHGTAFDIAWQGIANSQSMVEAIKLASKLVRPIHVSTLVDIDVMDR
jgi:4-hydroxythreonine-4-phosphate dehydrogenase